MLRSIHVKNMALIEEEEITLDAGLNILTGETGAGKSIVIGSISAALGMSSFKEFAKEGADQALVELTFETKSGKVRSLLEQSQIMDMDGLVIISRRFSGGRSISRINGEVVTIRLVRELASCLIDIHGQHEHQSLLYEKNHLALIDAYASDQLKALKAECREHYREWSKAQRELEEALSDERDRLKQIDLITFEIDQIDQAALTEGEDEALETAFRRLSHAQKIQNTLREVSALMDQNSGAGASISMASGRLASVSELDEGLQQLNEIMMQIDDLCIDFIRSLSDYKDDLTSDEQELNQVADRLDLINRLKDRYGKSIREILSYRDQQEARLVRLTDYDTYVEGLRNRIRKSEDALLKACRSITSIRKTAADELRTQIVQSLTELNFPDVRFETQFEQLPEPTANGADSAVFQVSLNPGQSLKPLQHVASGGELSRIMLGIKTVMAGKDDIETLIFDEIDSGISGRTAQKVSEKMAQLSCSRQVIAITHLAQIASMADNHYLIEKYVQDGMTHTGIRQLSEKEQEEELARILGGAQITDTVRNSAAEMKSLAEAWKHSHA